VRGGWGMSRPDDDLLGLLVAEIRDYAILMLDANGNVATWNAGAQRFKGYEADEIIGRHFSVFYPPQDIAAGKPERELRDAAAVGRFEDEGWRVRKDGSRFWANVVITALRDADGSLRGYGKVTRDITERHAAEAELELRAELLDSAHDAVVVREPVHNTITFWNREAENVYGYSRDQAMGQVTHELLATITPDGVAAMDHTLAQDGRWEGVLRHTRQDGEVIVVSSRQAVRRDADGRATAIIELNSDITERELAETTFRQLLEATPDAIVGVGRDGRIVLVNARTEQLFGYRREQLIGQPVEILVPERSRGGHADQWAGFFLAPDARATGAGLDLYGLRCDGSEFPAQISLSSTETADGPLATVAIRDDTARRLAEIVAAADDAIITKDLAGTITSWNAGAQRLYGYSAAEVHGKSISLLVPAHDNDEVPALLARLAQGESIDNYETVRVRKDRSLVHVSLTISAIRDPQGHMIAACTIARDVSERKRAEAALRAAQDAEREATEMFETAFSRAPTGVALLAMDGVFLRVNATLCDMLGRPEHEIVGSTSLPFTHPDDLTLTTDAYEKLRTQGPPVATEKRYLRPDGHVVWASNSGVTIRSPDGGPKHIVGHFRDVTELKVAELERAEATQRFETAFADASIGMMIAGVDGRYLQVNDAFCAMLGRSPEALVGLAREAITHPDDVAGDEDAIRELFAGGTGTRSFTREKRFLHVTGRVVWVSVNVTLIRDSEGQPDHFIVQAQDITDRKQSEDRLRLHAELLDLAHDAVIVRDTDSTVTFWNQGAVAVYGYSATEAVGQTTHDLLQTVFPESRETIDDALGRAGHWQGELRHTRKDGEVIVVSSRQALQRDSDGRPGAIVEMNSDITERKRIADELSVAHAQAVKASRLKSVFVANMSHEIRTPLNGVIGMAGLLADTALDGEQREYVDAVRTSGEALMAVIEDILDFSKIEAGKLELETRPFDVRELVEGACGMLAAAASSKDVELMTWLDDGILDAVYGDGPRLRQVLVNLLTNAVKFTAAGEVVVHVSEHHDGERSGLRFDVSDTGIGIDASATEQIFDSFTQADNTTTRSYGGTGLGLAISKRLVELMGGQIGVHSTPGAGSTFWFTIAVDPAPAEPGRSEGPSIATVRTLIVDDNHTNRTILEHQLASWDMACTLAADARAALVVLRAAARSGRPYDLVVLDARMPHMNGLQLAAAIRSDRSLDGTRLLMLSSSGTGRAAAADAGIEGFVTKPVRQGRLRDEITRVLGLTAPGHGADSHRQASDRVDFSDLVRQPSVLVAEDTPVNQIVARRLLEKRGLRVDIACDGREALQRHANSSYELIFMDCQMPSLDGYQATEEIRRREGADRHTPIIALTAHTLIGDREQCLAAGMDDYLAKPIALDALDEILTQTLRPHDGGSVATATPAIADRHSGEEIAVFDPSCLAKICDGDEDIHRDLIMKFGAQADAAILQMCGALDRNDLQAVGPTAHALTGSSAMLGANRLSALTRRITDDIRAGNPINATATQAELTLVHAQTIDAFRNPDAD
jgi:two-component system, sensor histidine kinase and response regulator